MYFYLFKKIVFIVDNSDNSTLRLQLANKCIITYHQSFFVYKIHSHQVLWQHPLTAALIRTFTWASVSENAVNWLTNWHNAAVLLVPNCQLLLFLSLVKHSLQVWTWHGCHSKDLSLTSSGHCHCSAESQFRSQKAFKVSVPASKEILFVVCVLYYVLVGLLQRKYVETKFFAWLG